MSTPNINTDRAEEKIPHPDPEVTAKLKKEEAEKLAIKRYKNEKHKEFVNEFLQRAFVLAKLEREAKIAVAQTTPAIVKESWLARRCKALKEFKFPSYKFPSVKIDWSRFKWKQKVQAQSAVVAAVTPVRKRKNWIVVTCHIINRKLRLAWKHRPRPAFKLPSFRLPSVKIDWSRFKWRQRSHQVRPSRFAAMFRFKLPSFEVSPKLKTKIKTELRRLFTRRSRQTKQKQKSLLETLIMKISTWTWAYRSAQYVCQRWLAVLFIILMICLIVPVKKQEPVTQTVVQPPPVVATNAPQVAVAQPAVVPIPMVFIPVPQAPTVVTQTVYVPAPTPTVAVTTYVQPPTPAPKPVLAPSAVAQAITIPESNKPEEIAAEEGPYELVIAPGKEQEYFFPKGYDIVKPLVCSRFRNTDSFKLKINGKPTAVNKNDWVPCIRSLGFENTGDTDLVVTFTLVKIPEKPGLGRKALALF